jgi:hypothetical protein
MPKQVRPGKDVILDSFQNPFLEFDICLPARSRFGEGRDLEIWN